MANIRPKVWAAVAVPGLLAIAAFVFFRPSSGPDSQNVAPERAPINPAATVAPAVPAQPLADAAQARTNRTKPVAGARNLAVRVETEAAETDPAAMAEEERRDALIFEKAAQLNDWSKNDKDDTNSLQSILAELRNPIPEIRYEAIEAIVQFGSLAAIPELQKIVEETKDPREKAALLDTIEFLRLPSFSDVIKDRNKKAP